MSRNIIHGAVAAAAVVVATHGVAGVVCLCLAAAAAAVLYPKVTRRLEHIKVRGDARRKALHAHYAKHYTAHYAKHGTGRWGTR